MSEGKSVLPGAASVVQPGPQSSRGPRHLAVVAFPGDRRVWIASLCVLSLALVGIAINALRPRDFYTGTNSVGTRSVTASLSARQRLCVPGTDLPAGTGAVQFAFAARTYITDLQLTLRTPRGTIARGGLTHVAPVTTFQPLVVPLYQPLASSTQGPIGTVCLTWRSGGPANLGGFATLASNMPSPTVDGKPVGQSISLWFLPPAGVKRSLASSWSQIMSRLALFRPGFAKPVFYWLLFLLVLPLLSYAGLRVLAQKGMSSRRTLMTLALIGFVSAAAWAVTTVPFDAPDEPEHFAYTERVAETGQAPDPALTNRSQYASDETEALDGVHHFSFLSIGDTRPPWSPADVAAYESRLATTHPSRSDGGQAATATQLHSPLYYTLLVPGYELGRAEGTFDELWWMRLTSALMAAVVVATAFAALREIVPGHREVAVAGALLIAFQPMFSFIGGAVNNDNGVNAMAALAVYLTVRALRRGLSWRLGILLGLVASLLPIIKGTGLALLPAIVLALLAKLALSRSRQTLMGLAATVASFFIVGGIWAAVASGFHRSASGTASGANVAAGQLGGKLTYLWEVFLPRLPFMAEHWVSGFWPFRFIYVERGFAAFGWYAIFFPAWVYTVIVAVMIVLAAAAAAGAVRLWPSVRRRWPAAAFLLLVIMGVIAGVEFAYYAPTPRPIPLTPEQGRYAFTAIIPLAGLALMGFLALPRRFATMGLAAFVSGMMGLALASHVLYVAQNFT